MGSSENFCVKWDAFEANISTSFNELRENSELFDATLCCDNGTGKSNFYSCVCNTCPV